MSDENAADESLVSADQLSGLGDVGRCELIRGKLIRMSPAGGRHGKIALKAGRLVGDHVEVHKLGEVSAAETGFIISRNPDTVRAPDVGFVAAARVPPGGVPVKFWPFAPDLAIEVVSPDDSWGDVVAKAHAWIAAGCHRVWVVDPDTRTVTVYGPERQVRELSGTDELSGEDILPGFQVRVAQLFD